MATVFLMTARILYDKGYTQFVDAAKKLHKEGYDAQFWLLGSIDSSQPNHVPERVILKDHGDGHIIYKGFETDVRDVIKKADCVVLPSFYNEGMSRVLMEAMALKRIIITTDMPGCHETVDDGVNGFIIPIKDSDALADAMKKVMSMTDEEKRIMGEAGRAKVEKEFDIRNVINIYKSITSDI